jgi:SagB-type dehydrogenase family enzyme
MPDVRPSISQHYHQRTKYDPETLNQRGRTLDFSQQPVPFKTYKVGTEIDLKPYLEGELATDPQQRQRQRLSHLLYHSYGVTAVVPYPDKPFYMRAAPSAGGLYPTELYLIAREDAVLPTGLYNYQVQTHSLWRFWDNQVWSALEEACLWHPALSATQMVMVLTAVFWRSAWRYEDRAYRRIFLDGGHLLGNIELAAAMNDYRPHLMGGFVDEALNQILYLDEDQEGAIAALALADLLAINQNLQPTPTALPSETDTSYPEILEGELLHYCHESTEVYALDAAYPKDRLLLAAEDKYNFPFCLKVPTTSEPIQWGNALTELAQTIRVRRSTRRFTGGAITLTDLSALLDFTYHPEHYQEQGLDPQPDTFDLSLIQTFVAVSDVTGLEAGCYYYAAQAEELRQIRFKNFRRELHYLCLQQDLGRDAAAVIFHTADLGVAIATYGDRAYRYLHMDAGYLGQRLNLAAIRLQLGVSGIAGFFDDHVNEVLGIPTDEAVLYITTFGQPSAS